MCVPWAGASPGSCSLPLACKTSVPPLRISSPAPTGQPAAACRNTCATVTPVIERLTDPSGHVLAGRGIYYWAGSRYSAGNRAARELRYLDLESRRDVRVLETSIPAVPNLTISPDGRRLCFPLVERNSQEHDDRKLAIGVRS